MYRAAPKLLAALKALEDRAGVVIENDTDDGKPEDVELVAAWKAARAAIAQAEGAVTDPAAVARPRVVVEVSGGVAEVTECPDGVDVDIVDHDNIEAEKEDELAALMGRAVP